MQPTGKKLENMETNELIAMRTQVNMELERRRREDVLSNGGFICRDCGSVVPRSDVINARGDISVAMDKHRLCRDCYGQRRAKASQTMIEHVIGGYLKLEAVACLKYDPEYVHASKLVLLHENPAVRFVVTGGMEAPMSGIGGISISIRPDTGDII